MGNRGREVDVAEALAANFRLSHFHAAFLADDAAVLHALILAAKAFVVLDRSKDFRAEEAVALGLERAVVDRLRLLHFAEGPLVDHFRAS